jgi:hypothetical protein
VSTATRRKRASEAWRPRLRGWLRVAGFLAVVSAGLGYVAVRSAYAETERAIRGLGQQLVQELGPALVSTPQALSINGERLFISSTQSALSVREVLDQLAASCASRTASSAPLPWIGQLPSAPAHSPRDGAREAAAQEPSLLLRALLDDPGRLSILRNDSAEEGHLACLAQPGRERGLSAFLERAGDFVASGDLSRLGDVRYVAARKLENGKTHVIAVWSEGEFRIGALFPEAGDAPGSDLPDVPRPPDATRQLCATAAGRAFGLRLYDSARPRHEVLAFYERELPSRGWDPLPTGLEAGKLRDGTSVRAFSRAGHVVAFGIGETDAGKTGISLIDLGSVGRSAASAESPFN